MVQVYREPLAARHHAPLLSFPALLRAAGLVCAVLVSAAVAFNTGGMWVKARTHYEQPAVKYLHDLVVVLEGPGAEENWFWSTFPDLNEAAGDRFVAAQVTAAEVDANHDGKLERVDLRLKARGVSNVRAVRALAQFQYALRDAVDLQMTGLAYVEQSSGIGGSALSVDGELRLHQSNLLEEKEVRRVYMERALEPGRPGGAHRAEAALRFGPVLSAYRARNETTVLADSQAVWEKGVGGDFELTVSVRVPPVEEVVVRPRRIEVLKFGWIQFLATLVVFLYVLGWFEWFLFHYRILHTRVIPDTKPKAHRF